MNKLLCLQVLFLFFSGLVQATEIDAKVNGLINADEAFVKETTYQMQLVLDQFVEEELGCSRVRLTSKLLKKGKFWGDSRNLYEIRLTATCTQNFGEMKLFGYSSGIDHKCLGFSYFKNAHHVEKAVCSLYNDDTMRTTFFIVEADKVKF